MNRLLGLSSLVAALGLTSYSAADGISLHVEMVGSVAETRNQFTLTVAGESAWTLELSTTDVPKVRDHLRKYPGGKVRAFGAVGVRAAGNVLELRDRTFRAAFLELGTPGIKVKSIIPGSPAETKLALNDIIYEIQEKEVTTYDAMIQFLYAHRGETIRMVVIRDGQSIVVDKLALRTIGPPLGITGEIEWQWYRGGAPAPGTAAPPAASRP